VAERKLSVTITADAKKAQQAFGALEKSAARHGKGTEKALDGVKGRLLDIGVAGAGLFAFNEWNEAQKVGKQTGAVLKSTAGAAKVTADEVGALSERLSEQAAVDDELIQSGANLLLTFTKVRNEVGKGNNIFDRATETALDLSVALGTDMSSASMLVGKALNDPLKGLTALSRAGVQFTQDQKDQIRALVETGDTLGAQKIILQELETQVKGSAEAQATGYDRAKVSAGNLAETVGGILAPAVETAAGLAEGAANKFQDLDTWQQQLTVGIAGAGYVWLRWGEQATEALLNVTKSGRDADEVVSSVNSTIAKGATVVAAGVTSYNLAYEALEQLFDVHSDLGKLEKEIQHFADGASSFDEIAQAVGADDREGLVGAFYRANGAADSFGEGLGYLATSHDVLGGKMRDAINKTEDFDSALASLVESGNGTAARDAADALTESLIEQGLGVDEIAAMLPQYNAALDDVEKKNGITGEAVVVLTNAMLDQTETADELGVVAGAAFERIERRVNFAKDAVDDFYGTLFGTLSTQIDAEAELDALTRSLIDNGLALSIDGPAGRENRQAMIDATLAYKDYAQSLMDTEGPDAARNAMEAYRLKLIDTLKSAGFTKDQVAALITEMGLTPEQINTTFSVDVGGALAQLDRVQQKIDSLSLGATLAGLSGPYGGGASGGNASGGAVGPVLGWRGVNESGDEFFKPNVGRSIVPVGPTRNALASGGGQAQPLVVQLTLDGRVLAQQMIRDITRDTRAHGGRSRLVNTPYFSDLR